MTSLQKLSLKDALFHGTYAVNTGHPIKYTKTGEEQYTFSYPFGANAIEINLFFNIKDSEKTTIKGKYSLVGTSNKGDLIFNVLEKTIAKRILLEGEASGFERTRFYMSFPKL